MDDAGTVVSSDVYDAWGNREYTTDVTGDPYGYKGQFGYYTDHETGMILCTHRYYDPLTGRWLTKDPIGHEGGVNLYGYCGNDSVNGVDPSGLQGDMVDAISDGFLIADAAMLNAFTFGIGEFIGRPINFQLSDGSQATEANEYGFSRGAAGVSRDALLMAGGLKWPLKLPVSIKLPRGRNIKLDIHYHKSGPHMNPHFQINSWIKGISNSGKPLRIILPFLKPVGVDIIKWTIPYLGPILTGADALRNINNAFRSI